MLRACSRVRVWGAVAALSLGAAMIAGCGSSSSTTAAGSSTSSSHSSSGASGLMIATAKGSDGTYLTGASGRALYLWVADSNGRSNCSGSCATNWPPVIVASTPKTSGAAIATDLGTITRSDGSKQLTYRGHPLYYFAGDGEAGETNGQGSDGFGALWWLVSPAGTAITSKSSSSSGAY